MLSHDEGWVLLVACGIHNHLVAKNLKGYSLPVDYQKKRKVVVNMSKTRNRSIDILQTLKQKTVSCEHIEDSL